MPRIIDYPETTTVDDNEEFLLDGEDSNKKVKYSNLLKPVVDAINALSDKFTAKTRRTRRNITNNLTNLRKAIAEQNLEKYGYSIGDYFVGPTANYVYHLADLDTYYGAYDSHAVVSSHHIAIVVDTKTNSQWYTSNATSKGYNGSTLHTFLKGTALNNIKADMKALFGGSTGLEYLISHQKLLTTATSNWAWQTGQYISALTEVDMYGSRIWAIDGYQFGESCKQLALFLKYRFNEIFGNVTIWLRSIQSSSTACAANDAGYANLYSASSSYLAVGLILLKGKR